MPSYTTLLTLLALTTLSLARPQRRPTLPQLNTIATLRLDFDIGNEGAVTFDITVGTQVDTNVLLEGAQISFVEGGDIAAEDVVCRAANQGTIVGEFTLAEAAIFAAGEPILITAINCA